MSGVILGIDPGLTRCGVAVIQQSAGRKVSMLFVDTFKTPPDMPLEDRIFRISEGIEAVIKRFKPSSLAIERVFAQANLRSVMGVAQISGVVLYLAKKYELPVSFHTPSEVKAAVTGSGRAEKAQIGQAVMKILDLKEIPKPADSADALAIAICNAWKNSSVLSGTGSATSAQQAWLEAERVARRKLKA